MNLVLDHVSIRERERLLLADVSLSLEPGAFVVLVGPNGAGKSTLLRASVGVLRPTSGTVTVGGSSVRELKGRDRAGRISWMPQRGGFHEPMLVLDFVCSARFRFNETRASARLASSKCLAEVGAAAFVDRDLSTLSGGEQQRVALAALIAQDAPLLLLDEPAAHLDPRQQLEVHSLLAALWREQKGILCATHDVNLLSHAITPEEARRVQVVGLSDGRVRFSLAYGSAQLGIALGELFDVEMRTVEQGGRRYFLESPRASA